MPVYRLHLTRDPVAPDRYVDDFSHVDELKPGDTFPYEGTVWQVIDVADDEDSSRERGVVQCAPALVDEPGG
jgi:hypothetical protein